ncbi:outer membrane protein insertion porin family protein [Dioscorea alata]|uniref:Outer membrane protein insertion porin family protein n=1 Tax=Dioscorea alata TaxID=55571 RepID=A0ACB7U8V9_DIOAL|nr:outer membrane protein insertion porin family protein [Dioscorea alata]
MATLPSDQVPSREKPLLKDEEDDGDEDDYEDEEDEEEEDDDEAEDEEEQKPSPAIQKARVNALFSRTVRIHVCNVVIKGNSITKDHLIEAHVADALRSASTIQELLKASVVANARLRQLGIFDSVSITLDEGPPGLPGTANVIIEVVEVKNKLTGDLGVFSRPEERTWSLEGLIRRKNFFGYGDIWDATVAYGWDQTAELSAGVSLPRFGALPNPLMARVSLLTQDWLKLSSYKEHLLGLSLGFLSTRYHDLTYNLTWRTLIDPSQMASKSVRRQLGHSLLSSIKYTFKIDKRNSHVRPRHGYAFLSSSQIAGLVPDSKSLRFIRQEFDLRGAFPLGFYNAALNVGVAAGFVMPWGSGFVNNHSPLPEQFFMGGHSSPVCTIGGPTSLLGFKYRGLGPTDTRRHIPTDNEGSSTSVGSDAIGGDIAVGTFADLSFDLPLKLFRQAGIHGHAFICAGNLAKLFPQELKSFSLHKFGETFRSSAGFGVIVPTKLFRMEINYCYILRQSEHDRAKTGIQFSFSSL